MSLSSAQKRYLRGLTHHINPVVMVGEKGLTENVLLEIEQALDHHELIKVSVRVGDRKERDAVIRELCNQGAAEMVQRVGNMALLYRENPDKKQIRLPQSRQT